MELELKPKNQNDEAIILEATTESFEADVILQSQKRPVIVDFWAPWCGPCKQLMPLLEKHVMAQKGKLALVKINIDQNPELAQALRVQSVPTVYAFWQGQPVDGFTGAQGQAALKAFFDKLAKLVANTPNPQDKITAVLAAGKKAFDAGDFETATSAFIAVLEADEENVAAKAGMARCLIAGGDTQTATEMLDDLGDKNATHPDVLAARAALALKAGGVADDEITALESAIAKNPKDFEKRFDLAKALAAADRREEAIEHLLEMYRLDRKWNDEAARKQLLVIFDSLGAGNALAATSRRRLSSLMFS